VHSRLLILALLSGLIAACNGEIYLRDGVTDGDTFYLAERALTDSDPALQSWVSYSLAISACQLQSGGDNPARASSFDCELTARRLMLETWLEKQALNPDNSDQYLDDLALIQDAGYLHEHIARHFAKSHWDMPDHLQLGDYKQWARENIPRHKAETRIIGSWNYASSVSGY
jgi:hypothetical protein